MIKRKVREYPTYDELLKRTSPLTFAQTSFGFITFFPRVGKGSGEWLHVQLRDIKTECLPNTEDGYKQAIELYEKHINDRLDSIENEFYEND